MNILQKNNDNFGVFTEIFNKIIILSLYHMYIISVNCSIVCILKTNITCDSHHNTHYRNNWITRVNIVCFFINYIYHNA